MYVLRVGGQVAADPKRRPDLPNPPREMVEDLNEGRAVAERATWVRPVFEPALRLSAVRKLFGLAADRYSGCDIMERRPPIIDPIM